MQERLLAIRSIVREMAPEADEKISYGIPAFDLHGPLVYYAAFSRHIGFYPTSDGIEAFQTKLGDYATSRGTVRFPLNQPLPIGLIREIVHYRIRRNLENKEQPESF